MDVRQQIRSGLQGQGFPAPTLSWIQTSALSNRNPPLPPLPSLIATAKARLLAVDLTNPAVLEAPAPALPANLVNVGAAPAQMREARLPHDVLVQVLDIDNLSKSKWEQVEELEAIARGEQKRGREIVRLPTAAANGEDGEMDDASSTAASVATQSFVNGNNNNNNNNNSRPNANVAPGRTGTSGGAGAGATAKNSTHRLVLQDCRGQKIHGLELRRIDRIGVGTLNIGEKMMLKKGAVVARGVVLLEPDTCVVLGGKVEAWQKVWIEGRLARLKEAVGDGNANGHG